MRLTQRILLTLSQVALVLPFIAVTDCSTGERTVPTGLEVYANASQGWIWLGIGLLVALLLAAWPWRPGDAAGSTAPGLGLRAFFASLALGLAFTGPVLSYLFDEVRPHVGWFVQLACWGLLTIGYLGGAGRSVIRREDGDGIAGPEQAGVVLVLTVPFLVALVRAAITDDTGDVWNALVSLGASIPLAVALIGVGRRESSAGHWRAAVWLVSALWLAGWVAALVG